MSARNEPEQTRPLDVILVTASSFRPDLPILGHSRDTTPLLGPFLTRSRFSLNCRAVSGSTAAACQAILSGQPPTWHGPDAVLARPRQPPLPGMLGPGYERFAAGNLAADAAAGGAADLWLGLEDAFDEVRWFPGSDHAGPFEEAARCLSRPPTTGRPRFLFLHTGMLSDALGGSSAEPASSRAATHARYGFRLEQFDRQAARLFDLVDFSQTLVILVGCHGEGVRPDLGRVGHGGRLHDDLLRVPLFVWLPDRCGLEPGGDDQICSTLDIAPTVLGLLGLPAGMLPGRSLLEARSPGHRPLAAADRGVAVLPGSPRRYTAGRHRVAVAAEITWPLKRISTRVDERHAEEWYHLARDPGEERELGGLPPPAGLPRLSIVVALDDREEFQRHVAESPLFTAGRHEWILLDNAANRIAADIGRVYARGHEQATSEIIIFAHQDVFFPPGWEQDLAAALARLDAVDPDWGVIGSVGVAADPDRSGERRLVGHWSDPGGYRMLGPLPAPVQSLDEMWLAVRRESGLRFDESLPGFHCYGVDLCLTAASRGLGCYAVDAFVWHKRFRPDGALIGCPADSPKIARRTTEQFIEAVQPGYRYVGEKWRSMMPFASTSMRWLDADRLTYEGPARKAPGPGSSNPASGSS